MLEAEWNRHRPDAVRADTPHAPPILFSVMDALFFAVHCSRSCHRRIGGDGHSVADQREFFGHIIAQRIADMGVLLFSQHSQAKTPHSATSSIPAHIPAPTRVTPLSAPPCAAHGAHSRAHAGYASACFLRRRSALPSTGPTRAMSARTSSTFLMGQPLAALPQERRQTPLRSRSRGGRRNLCPCAIALDIATRRIGGACPLL